jgi:hypothetical protein
MSAEWGDGTKEGSNCHGSERMTKLGETHDRLLWLPRSRGFEADHFRHFEVVGGASGFPSVL